MSQDLHQETITLFNHHPKTDKWYSTVLTGVHLELARGAAPSVNAGIIKGDDILAILPVSTGKTITEPDGETVRQYVRPKEYDALEDTAGHFTFHPQRDFFVMGNQAAEPVDDDDYEEGFYHAMNDSLDEVYMIESASYFNLIPHFEIVGR